MIALVDASGHILFGPAPWSFQAILEHLIIAGFDLQDGVLYRREDAGDGPALRPVCPFPDFEPQGHLILDGFTILPAVEVDEPTPEGKTLAGRAPVILEDRMELRPVWADIPPPPALEVHDQAARVTKLEFASRFTAEERQAILDAAGKRDADGRLVHPDVADAVNMVQMTPESAGINLRSPLLAGYASLLVPKGLLTPARAAAILTP